MNTENSRCVNLGFMDYYNFRLADYENEPHTLIVKLADCDIYLLTADEN